MSGERKTFNPSQRMGLDIDRHIALDAGAGTGKTTVMAERYVQHLIAPLQRSTLVLPCHWRRRVLGCLCRGAVGAGSRSERI